MSSTEDYYGLLEVAPGAGDAELRSAWRRIAMRWHPDRAGSEATAAFQRLSAAWAVLSDPVARAAYDRRRTADASPRPGSAGSPGRRRAAPAVMLQRLSGPLRSLLACGVARQRSGGAIDLLLNAREAAAGGMITISMRVPVRCPACAGSEGACERCGGARTVEELFSAWLSVAPGARDGETVLPSVLLNGMVRPPVFRLVVDRS